MQEEGTEFYIEKVEKEATTYNPPFPKAFCKSAGYCSI